MDATEDHVECLLIVVILQAAEPVALHVWVDAACIRISFRQARCVDDDALVELIPAPVLVADVDDYDADVSGNR